MFREFKTFLLKQNAMALAIGVVIGAAVGKVVSSLVDNVVMPVVGLIVPSGSWRAWSIPLRSHEEAGKTVIDAAVGVGPLLGALVDFLIIGLVVFMLTKALLPKLSETPQTRTCPQCGETIPSSATRCRACTQPVA
ncbi:MAG: large conductance mechanosensitive channel protein MscL [Acidobacteriota bacterium]